MRKFYYISSLLLLLSGVTGGAAKANDFWMPGRYGMGDVLTDTLVQSVCDSGFLWRGTVYQTSGVYKHPVAWHPRGL